MTDQLFNPIYVVNRHGEKELADFTKVDYRLNWLNSRPYQLNCNASFVAQRVRDEITDGIETRLLDEYSAKVAAELGAYNPDFLHLAARIAASNHQKNTSDCFSDAMRKCYTNKKVNGKWAPRINAKLNRFVQIHKDRLNKMVDYNRDFIFSYFGFTTLMDRYLIKRSGPRNLVDLRPQDYAIERPQDMWMRVACAIHMNRADLEDDSVLKEVEETYEGLSLGYIMHATPTLYNAGTDCEQFLSCFLLGGEDSIAGIYKLIADAAEISKYSGGIGTHWDLRCAGSEVQTTNGTSDGPIPFLRVMAATMQAVNQGGKRAGSAADYMEPTHPDFMRWVKLKRPGEVGAIDTLFYAVWCPDEFMRRVERDDMWYFVDPHDHPELYSKYDEPDNPEWTREYERIIALGPEIGYKGEPVKARKVMKEICHSQCETGMPYMLYKDACNSKSNQKNIGVIKSSNLCVAGDTPILTSRGWINIDTLADQVVDVWNGSEFSGALVKQTAESAELLEIETSDGCYVHCTPYHKFLISNGKGNRGEKIREVEAKDLQIGQCLMRIPKLPVIDEGDDFPYAYTAGAFTGDGTYYNETGEPHECGYQTVDGGRYCKRHADYTKPDDTPSYTCQAMSEERKPKIELYGEKKQLLNKIEHIGEPYENAGKTVVRLPLDIPEKYTVPINYNLRSKLAWLAGLIDTDGTTANGSIQISSVDQEFLLDVKLMCQTLGINPTISKSRDAGERLLPDGRGGKKLYKCKCTYKLLIARAESYSLYQLGMKTYRVPETAEPPKNTYKQYVYVTSVRKLEGKEPTYCFGEPKLNRGMFGGMLLKNCAEILEYSSSTEYACCCVSSLCLNKFVIPCDCQTTSWSIKGHVEGHQQGCNGRMRVDYDGIVKWTRVLTRNLNKIIDVNYYPVAETRTSNTRHRPLAIGVQGLADMFHKLKYPFTSAEARAENKRVFETIYWGAVTESNELARQDGSYETFRGDPVNNPTRPDELSPFAKGIFQFDMWGLTKDDLMGRWDWESMRERVRTYGMRNSLLTSLPPTASTSHIQGNNECLHGETPVTLSSGLAIPIAQMPPAGSAVIGYNNNAVEVSLQSNLLDQGERDTIRLTMIDGTTITCTPDHKFLLSTGEWIEAQKITRQHRLVAGVSGAVDITGDDETEFELRTATLAFDMKTPSNRARTLAFARILGYALADGSVDRRKYQTVIDLYMGTKYDVSAVVKDIALLEGKDPIVTDTGCVYRVRLHHKLSSAIGMLPGVASGKRSSQAASLPEFITQEDCPKAVVREFLAGIMGGDGIMPFISKQSTFRSHKLEWTVHKDYVESMRETLSTLAHMFDRVGVPGGVISGPFEKSESNILGNPDNVRMRLSFPCSSAFADRVGVRYCINKLYRLTIASMYWRHKETVSLQRKQVVDTVLSRIGTSSVPGLIQRAHEEIFANQAPLSAMSKVSPDDIKYYKKIGGYTSSNRSRSEISPAEFIASLEADFVFSDYAVKRDAESLPKFYTQLVDLRAAGKNQVWDISVDKTHSFIAAGVMVHNCFEPYTDNIYVRKTLSGENLVVNQHLIRDLIDNKLWTTDMRNKLIANRGSVQMLNVPQWIKDQYLTAWELPGPDLVDMDADRAPFIDQTQSSNRFMLNATWKMLRSMHMRCWKKGLKTGMYYLRSLSGSKAQQFSEAVYARRAIKSEQQPATIAANQNVEAAAAAVEQELMQCHMWRDATGKICHSCQ